MAVLGSLVSLPEALVPAGFFAVVFLAAGFLAVVFLAAGFFAVVFFAVVFFAVVFFAVVFFAVVFLAAVFFAVVFFAAGLVVLAFAPTPADFAVAGLGVDPLPACPMVLAGAVDELAPVRADVWLVLRPTFLASDWAADRSLLVLLPGFLAGLIYPLLLRFAGRGR